MARAADKRTKQPGPSEAALAEYVEYAGLVFEKLGMPRIAGKTLGYLLVCEPPHQSQAALVEALGASKGSISTVTRQMEGMGAIERVRLPGERVDYFRVPSQAFTHTMQRQWELRRMSMDDLTARGLELLAEAPQSRSDRLRRVRAFHEFMNEEMRSIVDRWYARLADAHAGLGRARKPQKRRNTGR